MNQDVDGRRGKRFIGGILYLGVALAVGLSAWPDASWANKKMRCGNHLVGKGSYREEVVARCGQPYSTYRYYWLYRKGKVVYRVQFNSRGTVSRLTSEIVY